MVTRINIEIIIPQTRFNQHNLLPLLNMERNRERVAIERDTDRARDQGGIMTASRYWLLNPYQSSIHLAHHASRDETNLQTSSMSTDQQKLI